MSDKQASTPSELQDPLRECLRSFSDRRFVFVRPGGNYGDMLIYFGAEHLAAQLGLRWRTVALNAFSPAEVAADEVIFVHGGGGYFNLSHGRPADGVGALLAGSQAPLIQGPCTIEAAKELGDIPKLAAARTPGRFYFFARERRSLQFAQTQLGHCAQVALNEDTAFYLDAATILARIPGAVRDRYDLVAVREDNEAVNMAGKPDLLRPVLDPARYALSFEHWLRLHAGARSIIANRTHSSICGAILGIPTTMFANVYHKNRSIWEVSLRQRGVKWMDDPSTVPVAAPVDPLLAWIPNRRIRDSWRLGRWANRIRGVPLS